MRSEREATPELCREMEAVEQAPQRPWRTEASRREAGTAVASIAGRVGKKRSWHPGHFFVGDLWESRREAEEQIGPNPQGCITSHHFCFCDIIPWPQLKGERVPT